MSSYSDHQLTTPITTEVMTMTIGNFNLENFSFENKSDQDIHDELIFNARYVLTSSQYDELERIALHYDALHSLLSNFDIGNFEIASICNLMEFINTSLFENLEHFDSFKVGDILK